MGTGNTTGEVFRTDAPIANSTYWRMFRGGKQYGLLYNLTSSNDFNVKALDNAGNLWLRNSLDNGIRLNSGTLTTTIGAYSPSISSFVGIGPNSGIIGTQGAWARLHLDDGGAVITGAYRTWMKNGIYMSGNNDMMYVGQLFRAGADESDAVVAWGDNAFSPAGPDHLRFIFMGNGVEGEEVTRITGDGLFGIGNFDAAGVQPTERVDVHNGRLRLRSLPGSVAANTMTKVLVVDDSPNPSGERGVIKWRDVSTIGGGGGGCASGWSLNGTNAVTAFNGNPCPPQAADRVGIGANSGLIGKLHVVQTNLATTTPIGIYTSVQGGTTAKAFQSVSTGATHNQGVWATATGGTNTWGVIGDATGASSVNLAGQFVASGGTESKGVEGVAHDGSNFSRGVTAYARNADRTFGVDALGDNQSGQPAVTDVIGVSGVGQSFNNATRTVGLFGDNTGIAGPNTWAIWSDGFALNLGGPNWVPSDEELKSDIEEVTNSSEMLAQLTPKSYRYNAEAYPFMAFNEGRHYGIMAQDLEQLLPEAVREVTRPADLDEDGNEVVAAATFKAVNYEALVPLLIASNKEQQERIARLEEMVSTCCAAPLKSRATDEEDELELKDTNGDRRLMIQPNPFNERTMVSFIIQQAGRAQLIVNSSDGKDLTVLQDATLRSGEYRYDWNTSDLEPGMYYITLLVEGRPVVKKAVKVAR